MKYFFSLFILILILLNCNTLQKDTISKSQTKIQESSDKQEVEKIVENVYNKKESVRENQKEEFVEFFIRNIEESDTAKKSLINLHNDPNYIEQKELIWNNLIEHLENPEVFDFVQREVLKNPELYDLKLKQKLLRMNDQKSAKFLLDLIYIEKETLDPDIIYLFRNTSYEDSIPILVQSIEDNKFVEESIVAISSIPSEDAETYLINLASDYQNPHRNLALSHIVNIQNKELAYSIYKDILVNLKLNNEITITTTLNSLKKMVPYLNQNQKKELKDLLKTLPTRYKQLSEQVASLLQEEGNVNNLTNLNLEVQKQIQDVNSNEQKVDYIVNDNKIINDFDVYDTKKIAIKIKQKKDNENIKKNNNLENIKKQDDSIIKKEQTPNTPKKDKNPNQTNDTKKPNESKKTQIQKTNPQYSTKYVQRISSNMKKLFPENSTEIQKKIHNALLTYSKSNSDRAKFVQSAYKQFYNSKSDDEVKELLKQGLFTNQSLYAVLYYIKDQYKRKDLQVFALQELFLLKRIESKNIIDNINLFR